MTVDKTECRVMREYFKELGFNRAQMIEAVGPESPLGECFRGRRK